MSGTNRLHISKDGCVVYNWNDVQGTVALMPASDVQLIDGMPNMTNQLANDYEGIIIAFPKPCKVAKINWTNADVPNLYPTMPNVRLDVWVSTDSTTGLDGTWTQIIGGAEGTYRVPLQYNTEVANSEIAATWMRVLLHNASSYINTGWRSLHVFGEYQTPRFEFWNAAGNAELTADYPLTLTPAENAVNYSGYVSFTIKNTNQDGLTHSYSLTVNPVKYGGDSIVSSYFKLSTASPWTSKNTTVTVSNVANGSCSPEIRIYADIAAGVNPGNGLHQFAVDVTES